MAKARGKTTRTRIPKPAYLNFGEPSFEIGAWCPDPEAKQPPEQVHFVMHLPGFEEIPMILRFKSPDTLGFFIEELARYRREVWPQAEPLDCSGDPDNG